jgi:hypothetical protein
VADLGQDDEALWHHLAGQLPYSDFAVNEEIGWFTLLAVAGGLERYAVFTEVHDLSVDAGWREEDGGIMTRQSVNEVVWPTLAALIGARWNSRVAWPSWVPAAAASVIFPSDDGG